MIHRKIISYIIEKPVVAPTGTVSALDPQTAWFNANVLGGIPSYKLQALGTQDLVSAFFQDYKAFLAVIAKYEVIDFQNNTLAELMSRVKNDIGEMVDEWSWQSKEKSVNLRPGRFFVVESGAQNTLYISTEIAGGGRHEIVIPSLEMNGSHITVLSPNTLQQITARESRMAFSWGVRPDREPVPGKLILSDPAVEAFFRSAYSYQRSLPRVVYTPNETIFRYWAHDATSIKANIYDRDSTGEYTLRASRELRLDASGFMWRYSERDDLDGTLIDFTVTRKDGSVRQAADAQAKYQVGPYTAIVNPENLTAEHTYAKAKQAELSSFIHQNIIAKLPAELQVIVAPHDLLSQVDNDIPLLLAVLTKFSVLEIQNALTENNTISALAESIQVEHRINNWVATWDYQRRSENAKIGDGQWLMVKVSEPATVNLYTPGAAEGNLDLQGKYSTIKIGDEHYAVISPVDLADNKMALSFDWRFSTSVAPTPYRFQKMLPNEDMSYPYFQQRQQQGSVYTPQRTLYQIFDHADGQVYLERYRFEQGQFQAVGEPIALAREKNALRSVTVEGDETGVFYRFVVVDGGTRSFVPDPNARYHSSDGSYSVMVDPNKSPENDTNHPYWQERKAVFERDVAPLLADHLALLSQYADLDLFQLSEGNARKAMMVLARLQQGESLQDISKESLNIKNFDAMFVPWSFDNRTRPIVTGQGLMVETDSPYTLVLMDDSGAENRYMSVKLGEKYCTFLLPSEVTANTRFSFIGEDGRLQDEKFEITRLRPENMSPQELDQNYFYAGQDLGPNYTQDKTTIKVWLPRSSEAKLVFYKQTAPDVFEKVSEVVMHPDEKGTWEAKIEDDIKNYYYEVVHTISGQEFRSRDNYAKAFSVGGKYSAVIDLNDTNPEGWEQDRRPDLKHQTDLLAYEASVYDLTAKAYVEHPISFAGMTEVQTNGLPSIVDYIAGLNVTAVQLMPNSHLGKVDERNPEKLYFWGYDGGPVFALNGAYATNPDDPTSAIREYKAMVKAFHDRGIRVIQDVQLNHAYMAEALEALVPNYYFLKNDAGYFIDGSGCGNQTASQHLMVRKLLKDILRYYVEELHVDGFRFDLMGLHDIVTMNEIREMLHEIDPTISIYGEGWQMGGLPTHEQASKYNAFRLPGIGHFQDVHMGTIAGAANKRMEQGVLTGKRDPGWEYGLMRLVSGSIHYNDAVNSGFAEPSQSINFYELHDGYHLLSKIWSWIDKAYPDRDLWGSDDEKNMPRPDEVMQMLKLAHSLFATSQGIFVTHGGYELGGNNNPYRNSYDKGAGVNALEYAQSMPNSEFHQLYTYFKNVNHLRTMHPSFHMPTADLIRQNLVFLNTSAAGDAVFPYLIINNGGGDDRWKNILTIHNFSREDRETEVPNGTWRVVLDGHDATEENSYVVQVTNGKIKVPALSTLVAYTNDDIRIENRRF